MLREMGDGKTGRWEDGGLGGWWEERKGVRKGLLDRRWVGFIFIFIFLQEFSDVAPPLLTAAPLTN